MLEPTDRAYFDFLRFTGLRKDEANRLRWDDINFESGFFHCRGTKTHESDACLPLAPTLSYSLKKHRATTSSAYVFAGRSAQTRGKKIYSRRKLFEKIERLTSSCQDCGRVQNRQAAFLPRLQANRARVANPPLLEVPLSQGARGHRLPRLRVEQD